MRSPSPLPLPQPLSTAFLGYSIGRERLVQEHRKRYDFLRQIIFQELADLQKALVIRADLDLTLETNALIALVDGIGTGVVICPEQFCADQQQYLVRRHINALLTILKSLVVQD